MELLELSSHGLAVKLWEKSNFPKRRKPISSLCLNPFKTQSPCSLLCFHASSCVRTALPTSRLKLYALSADPLLSKQEEEEKDETFSAKEKLGVLVKPMEKPRVVLKFIWMQKVIGIALDQVIPAHGTIPLSPYHFWPKQDAWEQLKLFLESKPWISQKQLHILLNQATDIINLWQESGGRL